jgi:hypothetical protein
MSDVDHIVQARRDYTRRRRLAFYYSARLHPEALDWQSRILAAGSSVSASTLQAASDFCGAIDAAGIRDRFVRLNLFAGNDLTAALVPIYRSTVPFATVIGNATDTNVNFVGADYVETGASAGIQGNGSNKHLETGVTINMLGANRHASAIITGYNNTQIRYLIASRTATNTNEFGVAVRDNSARYLNTTSTFYGTTITLATSGVFIGSSVGNNQSVSANGETFGTATSAAAAANDVGMFAFAVSNNGTAQNHTPSRLGGYSQGLDLPQNAAMEYAMAVRAFCLALSRPTF